MRRPFSRKVRAEIVERSKNDAGQICCEGCSLVLGAKRWDVDHTIPEALLVDKSRPLTAKDGKLLGYDCCHQPKTADDVRQIRKADRQRDNHTGARRSSRPLDGSRASRWRKPFNGPPVLR